VGYTQAIEERPDHAIYYANRAAAHIRLEEYGSAIADASKAIEVDPDYIKVRACAGGGCRLVFLLVWQWRSRWWQWCCALFKRQ
jgi:tetratricopeptide (TPR) repeat protein